jgi:hypothetical protein
MPTATTTAAPAQRAWSDEHHEKYTIANSSQQGETRLNASFKLYSYRPEATAPVQKYLLVSLDGSAVTPLAKSKLDHDQLDIRGWYTEQAVVSIGWQHPDAGYAGDPQSDILLSKDSPETTAATGSVTSSVSLDFNGGFFGTDLTGGAGMSISNSFTQSLSDFVVVNRSTEDAVVHELNMAMTRGGHPYRTGTDLVDTTPSGQFTGCPLFELPDRAVSNLPLVSQGLFWSRRPVNEDRDLWIVVHHRLRWVEKTFKFFTVEIDSRDWVAVTAWKVRIPFAAIA